jgi:hypothetical protein
MIPSSPGIFDISLCRGTRGAVAILRESAGYRKRDESADPVSLGNLANTGIFQKITCKNKHLRIDFGIIQTLKLFPF